MKPQRHTRRITYHGEELEIEFSREFYWETGDWRGSGWEPDGDISIERLEIGARSVDPKSLPLAVIEILKEYADEAQGEWE